MSLDPCPHRAYIAAVAAAAGAVGADSRYAAERFFVRPESDGLLTAILSYPPCRGAGPSAPGHGLVLLWDQRTGWRWVPRDVPAAVEIPLPVPVLAAPQVLTRLLAELLAGRTDELVASREQWPLTPTHRRLLGRLDVIEELEYAGWARVSAPDVPVVLKYNDVIWLLTAHHDIWRHEAPGADWRDSRLSSPAGTAVFGAGVPAQEILDAARDAVAGTWSPGPPSPAWQHPRGSRTLPRTKDPT